MPLTGDVRRLGEGLKSEALRWGFQDLSQKELTYMRGAQAKVVNLETTFAGYKISGELI